MLIAGAPYEIEATQYPADEPPERTHRVVGLLADVAAARLALSSRAEPDERFPEIGRYRELARAVEGLIDCAGEPFPDYREKLVRIAALALDAALAHDAAASSIGGSS